MGGVDAALAEGGGDDAAGDALAVADDEVGDAGSEFENGGEAAEDFVERVEFLVDEVAERGSIGRILDQRAGGVAMAGAQAGTDGESAGAVALARRQRQRGASWSVTLAMALTTTTVCFPIGYASGDDGGGAANGGRVFDRGAAKFHDDEAHAESHHFELEG